MSNQDDNQPYTPYAPPTANVEHSRAIEGNFIPGGRPVLAGSGIEWISSSWNLFKQQPGLWILFIIAYVFMQIALGFIPILGQVILMFAAYLIVAGVIYSCSQIEQKGSFVFGDLFIAFSRQTGSLLMIPLFSFVLAIALLIIPGILIGLGFAALAVLNSTVLGYGLIFVGGVIAIIGMAVVSMALWFTPALVLMHDLSTLDAMKMSFSGCRQNILPGIVFFIMLSILMLLSMIPLGLGLLITIPMFFICYYTTYRNVFFDTNT